MPKSKPDGDDQPVKRNLPSWMSSRADDGKPEGDVDGAGKPAKDHGRGKGKAHSKETESLDFSKLMEGVVFVLSGFVNPERGVLRSQALEMGAEYKPDWNLDCTLLVCAFPNTPKFRQVEADCGTIVSKEWISRCYKEKKLVDIETYLMHAGKPWRKQIVADEGSQEQMPSTSKKSQRRVERGSHSDSTNLAASKGAASNHVKDHFSPSVVKKWATDDFNRTILWLENQDEKPESSEMKKIAAEGILTCLQDTIDSLKQGQPIQKIIEQWECVPRVVEELAKFEGISSSSTRVQMEELYNQAMSCKNAYEEEFSKQDDDISGKRKKLKTHGSQTVDKKEKLSAKNDAAYDSDETVEMTEEEVEQAYNTVTSSFLIATK